MCLPPSTASWSSGNISGVQGHSASASTLEPTLLDAHFLEDGYNHANTATQGTQVGWEHPSPPPSTNTLRMSTDVSTPWYR